MGAEACCWPPPEPPELEPPELEPPEPPEPDCDELEPPRDRSLGEDSGVGGVVVSGVIWVGTAVGEGLSLGSVPESCEAEATCMAGPRSSLARSLMACTIAVPPPRATMLRAPVMTQVVCLLIVWEMLLGRW